MADLKAAGAVHVEGTMIQDGTEAALDMQLQDDGASGTLEMGGQQIELLVVGDEAYVQADAEFWKSSGSPEAFASMIAGRWLLMPAEQAGELGPLSLEGFAEELLDPESGVVEEVETGQVEGEDVLVVSTEDGSKLSVLTGDDSYPVLLEGTEENPGNVVLSGFGERQELEAPADFVDLADLGG